MWGKSLSFVRSSRNFVPGYIKNVDTHHQVSAGKKQVIKNVSPKGLWQTYMKWTMREERLSDVIGGLYIVYLQCLRQAQDI